MIVAVDVMGGDFGPAVNVKGALMALESAPDLGLCLVGDEQIVKRELRRHGAKPSDLVAVVPASETISMDDPAATSIRSKKNSSLHVGLELVKSGRAQAFFSAGHSGAVMAGAALILGRLKGVERPAILVRLPTAEGFVAVLDAGANVDCRPSHLVQFAEMGHVYASSVEGIERPRIALLANGSESHKGNELTRAAHEVLAAQTELNFTGYVEGFDVFRGSVDVVVCDGFVGNVLLKVAEGLADTTFRWFRAELRKSPLGLVGVALLKKTLKKFKSKFDYQPYGAAPLLGIRGMVLIGHGASTEIAIRNGILTAMRAVEGRLLEKMSEKLGRTRLSRPRKQQKA